MIVLLLIVAETNDQHINEDNVSTVRPDTPEYEKCINKGKATQKCQIHAKLVDQDKLVQAISHDTFTMHVSLKSCIVSRVMEFVPQVIA